MRSPGEINRDGGFSGHADWRLPTIKELQSIVEKQCSAPTLRAPAVNVERFPNDPGLVVWSSSPNFSNGSFDSAWGLDVLNGGALAGRPYGYGSVRLERGGQASLDAEDADPKIAAASDAKKRLAESAAASAVEIKPAANASGETTSVPPRLFPPTKPSCKNNRQSRHRAIY
jgi:hypothetical protein